jgi:membrane protease YdiL (CAAX protease family)
MSEPTNPAGAIRLSPFVWWTMPIDLVAALRLRQLVSMSMVQEPTSPAPWGFWATAGWVALAVVVGLAGAYLVGFGEGLDLLGQLPALSGPAGLVISTLAVFVLLLAARHSQIPVREYFALHRPAYLDGYYWAIGVTIAAILNTFSNNVADADFAIEAYHVARSHGTLPLLLVYIVIWEPLFEELVFRGFIFRGWSQRLGPIVTIVLTSALVSLIHLQYSWQGTSFLVGFGLVLGWVRWRTGSVVAPLFLHFTVNFITMMLTGLLHGN